MYQIKRTNKKFLGIGLIKILIILLLVVGFVFLFSISNSTQSLVSSASSPFFMVGNFFYNNLNKVPKFFSDKDKLITENIKLAEEIRDLKFNIIDFEILKYENQKLREQLEIKPIGDFITSSIIAKSPQVPLDSLLLNKGLKDGINKGDFVLITERILIGKIVDLTKNRATVVLNSFADVATYAFVARTDEPIELRGAGGGSIKAKVPIDFDIVVGDEIMIADSLNYIVAVVGVVTEDTPFGFKDVFLSLPADVSKTNIVFIKHFENE